MYLHIGGDTVVNTGDIIGIFDMDQSTVSYKTREFLSEAQKNGEIINVSYELPRSFVLCRENNQCKIYICQLSPVTLMKRAEQAEL
ncbi:MAG: DUF370 domain-containing protein [Clostridia bacterium]|nr:DUF370 domain-containing protein [Clostridia bacterium]